MTLNARRASDPEPQLRAGNRILLQLCALLLALTCGAKAAAQGARDEAVELSIPDCEQAPAAAIRKLVALDLEARGLRVAGALERARVRAELQCSGEAAALIVTDDRRATPLELQLPLRDTPPKARARFLALAMTELIATSELERPMRQREEPPTRPWRGAVWIAGGGMLGYEPRSFAPELQAGAAIGFERFSLQLDADFAWGARSLPAARVRTELLSLALAPGFRLVDGLVSWDLAAGVRAGIARLAADATQRDEVGRTLSGVWLAPLLQSALALRLAAHWRVQLGLEVEYIVKPMRGFASDGSTLIALRGVRAALLLGARFSWSE